MFSNNTFCNLLTRNSPGTSQEQSPVVKTKHKETKKRHPYQDSSSEDSDDADDSDTPTHKSPRVNSHHSCVQLSTAPAHGDDDKVSIPDEEEMNKNLKSSNDDGEDDFKELAPEINKEEGLGEPMQ